MKHILLAIPLLLLTPSCAGLGAWLGQPATPEVQAPAEGPETVGDVLVDEGAKAAGGVVTITTGNAALGGAVALVLVAIGRYFKRRKSAPAPVPEKTTTTF